MNDHKKCNRQIPAVSEDMDNAWKEELQATSLEGSHVYNPIRRQDKSTGKRGRNINSIRCEMGFETKEGAKEINSHFCIKFLWKKFFVILQS
jgi:hypothetical protein